MEISKVKNDSIVLQVLGRLETWIPLLAFLGSSLNLLFLWIVNISLDNTKIRQVLGITAYDFLSDGGFMENIEAQHTTCILFTIATWCKPVQPDVSLLLLPSLLSGALGLAATITAVMLTGRLTMLDAELWPVGFTLYLKGWPFVGSIIFIVSNLVCFHVLLRREFDLTLSLPRNEAEPILYPEAVTPEVVVSPAPPKTDATKIIFPC